MEIILERRVFASFKVEKKTRKMRYKGDGGFIS